MFQLFALSNKSEIGDLLGVARNLVLIGRSFGTSFRASARFTLLHTLSSAMHFGQLRIGRARRALMAFVMVLSWSHQVFVQSFSTRGWSAFARAPRGISGLGGLLRILFDERQF